MFFFFKQKTAYEMLISDWSSDVCASDLLDAKVRFKFGSRFLVNIKQVRYLMRPIFFECLVKIDGYFVTRFQTCQGLQYFLIVHQFKTQGTFSLDTIFKFGSVSGQLGKSGSDHITRRTFLRIGRASCRERVCQYG